MPDLFAWNPMSSCGTFNLMSCYEFSSLVWGKVLHRHSRTVDGS